jgi:hypothetical protein
MSARRRCQAPTIEDILEMATMERGVFGEIADFRKGERRRDTGTSVGPIFKVTLNFILNGLAKYKVFRTLKRGLKL